MTNLTELEQNADREARHGHRELVEKLEARVAELERQANDRAYRIDVLERDRNVEIQEAKKARRERDTAWNDAIRAAASLARYCHPRASHIGIAEAICTLLRNEGGEE